MNIYIHILSRRNLKYSNGYTSLPVNERAPYKKPMAGNSIHILPDGDPAALYWDQIARGEMRGMFTSIVGYPRVGALRELKTASEQYFRGEIGADLLHQVAADLRMTHWTTPLAHGLDYIPSNYYSYYDALLDTPYLLNMTPQRYKALCRRPLDTYLAMARGYQG